MAVPEPTLSVAVPEASPRFSGGAVVSRGISVWLSNLPLFLGLSVAVHLPTLVFVRAAARQNWWLRWYGMVALMTLLAYVVSGAVVQGVFTHLRGERASLVECLEMALRALPRIIGTSLATFAVVLLGAIFLVVPGVVMACSYYVAVPVAVVEKSPVFKCLSRSSELSDGSRWHVFGLVLAIRVVAVAVAQIASILFDGSSGLVRTFLVTILPSALTTSLHAVFQGVAYYQLRVVKEGIDIEQLAAVFD